MDYKKIALGVGAFTASAAALVAAAVVGDVYLSRREEGASADPAEAVDDQAPTPDTDTPNASEATPPQPGDATPAGLSPEAPAANEAPNASAEHVPTDLFGDRHPGPEDRAPEAFRPDPTAVPTAEEREALRPATGPAPTLVAGHDSGRT